MSRTPTQSDRADFAGYCRQATDSQVRGIYEKETEAGRRVYAEIAREEAERRGIEL